jgi:hypothetical protein
MRTLKNVRLKIAERNLVQKLPYPYIREGIIQKLVKRNPKLSTSAKIVTIQPTKILAD